MSPHPHPSRSELESRLLQHYAHLAACSAVLEFSPMREVLKVLQHKLPDAQVEVLLVHVRRSLKFLATTCIAEFFITESTGSRDLSAEEALREIDNPDCWVEGGRYLAAAKAPGSTYFASIHENLREYALDEASY